MREMRVAQVLRHFGRVLGALGRGAHLAPFRLAVARKR